MCNKKKYSWTHRKCAAARKVHFDRVQSLNYVFQLKSLWFGSWQKNSLESIICCKFFNWNRFASNRLSLEFQHCGLVFICYSVQMFISVWLWNICCCSHWIPFTCAKFREHCASRRRRKKTMRIHSRAVAPKEFCRLDVFRCVCCLCTNIIFLWKKNTDWNHSSSE